MQVAQNDLTCKKMSFEPAGTDAPRAYPQAIAQAADRATDDRIPEIAALDVRARGLLQKIVRSLPKDNPSESVRIKNDTFALVLGTSGRTVARIKCALEQAGFITRHQVQSRRRGMQVADIWLTDMAKRVLGLITPAPKAPACAKLADAYCLSQSLSERPPKGVVEEKQPEQPQTPPNSQSVPEDLHLLQDCGLNVPAIRKLMGMASKAGHRLGTIVQAAGKHILNATKPFCYMRKLIFSGKDWGAQAEAAQQEDVARAQESLEAAQRQADIELVEQEASKTGLLTSAKRVCAWAWIDGWLKRAEMDAVLAGGMVPWLPMPDISGVAQAIRDGKVFAVERAVLEQWASP